MTTVDIIRHGIELFKIHDLIVHDIAHTLTAEADNEYLIITNKGTATIDACVFLMEPRKAAHTVHEAIQRMVAEYELGTALLTDAQT